MIEPYSIRSITHHPPVRLPCISPELHIPFATDGEAGARSARQGGRKCRGRSDKESRDSELHGLHGGGRNNKKMRVETMRDERTVMSVDAKW